MSKFGIFYPKTEAQIWISWENKHYKIPISITHRGVSSIYWWKICFLAKFGLPKMQKIDFWPNLDLSDLAQSIFGIPKGYWSICSIPFIWRIHSIKNLLPAYCEQKKFAKNLWGQYLLIGCINFDSDKTTLPSTTFYETSKKA